MTKDPLIDEIRSVRQAISEKVGHDPKRIVEYYKKLQEELADRVISRHSIKKVSPQPNVVP